MPDNPSSLTLGDATLWTDEDINRLIGLSDTNEPIGALLITVVNDAGRYPELFAMITAKEDTLGNS